MNRCVACVPSLVTVAVVGCSAPSTSAPSSTQAGAAAPAASPLPTGFPAADAAQKAYDDADLTRAIAVYKFFYPTVSGAAIIDGEKNKAALRSLQELRDLGAAKSVDLYFGPTAPAGQENRWIKTTPGKAWFTYFRIYGPEARPSTAPGSRVILKC
jgi:hypothetical protein